jgi:hypothetical protein
MKLLVVGVVVLGAIGIFMWVGVVEGSIPSFRVHQFLAKHYEGECWVDDGKVRSIEHPAGPLIFTLESPSNPDLILKVESPRNQPPNFKIGGSVSCKGEFRPSEGKFYAVELTTKCPSRYKASEEVEQGARLPVAATPAASPVPPVPADAPAAAPKPERSAAPEKGP